MRFSRWARPWAYGFNTPFARLAHENGIDTTVAVLARASLMLAVAAGVALAFGAGLRLPPKRWLGVLVLALASALISVAYLGSVAFISVSLAAIIFFTFPLQILLLAVLGGSERVDARKVAIFLVAFVGLVLVIAPQWSGTDWRGIVLAGLASAAATAMYFLAHRLIADCSAWALIFWVHLIIVPIALVVTVSSAPPLPSGVWTYWWPVAALSLAYIAAFGLQMLALRFTTPVNAGLYFNFEPIMTGLVAAIFVGERLLPVQYGGAVLVIAVLVIASRYPVRH